MPSGTAEAEAEAEGEGEGEGDKEEEEEEEAASISAGLKWNHLNTVLKSELGSSFRLKTA